MSLQLFKSNTQAPLTLANALLSAVIFSLLSSLLLNTLRASMLYRQTCPKSWRCLSAYNPDWRLLLAKTWVKLPVSDPDACSELSQLCQEMTRGRPWTQRRQLNRCLLYLEGWTGQCGQAFLVSHTGQDTHWSGRKELEMLLLQLDGFGFCQELRIVRSAPSSFVMVGVVQHWSRLPRQDVESPCLETFKTQQNSALSALF